MNIILIYIIIIGIYSLVSNLILNIATAQKNLAAALASISNSFIIIVLWKPIIEQNTLMKIMGLFILSVLVITITLAIKTIIFHISLNMHTTKEELKIYQIIKKRTT